MKTTIGMTALAAMIGAAVSTAAVAADDGAERKLPLAVYRDKMEGAWIGQSVGVTYGAPTEFTHAGEIIPDAKMPKWSPDLVNGTFGQDDLYVEMTFLATLEKRGIGVSAREAGIDFANTGYPLWCANCNARNNLRKGIAAPWSSDPKNHPSTDDIDYQIEADFAGIISPGLPSRVRRLGETFGRIMNCGDGLYAGVFVGAMYAEAFFSEDRVHIVETALKSIPSDCAYAEMVRDMLAWYAADPADWRGAWRKAVDKWQAKKRVGRVSFPNIDVKVNGAMVLLGYLWGGGDPDRTMYISTAGGYDSDCNPSSACGVLFTSLGRSRLPEKFTSALSMTEKWISTDYTYPKLVAACERLAKEIVLAEGGRIEGDAMVLPRTPAKAAAAAVGAPEYTAAERAEIRHRPVPSGVMSFDSKWPAKHVRSDKFQGFTRHVFEFEGLEAWLVQPNRPREGRRWVWCTEWPDAFVDRTGAVAALEDGFYYLYLKVGYECYGSPKAMGQMDRYYRFLREFADLAEKGVVTGVSRGGFYAYRFASLHPDRVCGIYGDAPCCDLKSYPTYINTVKGGSEFNADELRRVCGLFGLKDREALMAFRGNPVDVEVLRPIAAAKIPILNVVGEADVVVPPALNADIVEKRYRELGGEIAVIRKPKCGHHPHGLDADRVGEILDFFRKVSK